MNTLYLQTSLRVFALMLLLQSSSLMAQNGKDYKMVNAMVNSDNELVITASKTSSRLDFDFLIGKWKVHNRMLKKRLDNGKDWREFDATQEMHTVLNGVGNVDNFFAEYDDKPFEGMAVRLFDVKTNLWSIYWADSRTGVLGLPPVVGSFENKIGHFYAKEIFNGKNVITVYQWDVRDEAKPVWSQAMSEDNGLTWEWNWYMYLSRDDDK